MSFSGNYTIYFVPDAIISASPVFHDITLVVILLLYAFVLYVIRNEKKMDIGAYKSFLLTNATLYFVTGVMNWLLQPENFYPYRVAALHGLKRLERVLGRPLPFHVVVFLLRMNFAVEMVANVTNGLLFVCRYLQMKNSIYKKIVVTKSFLFTFILVSFSLAISQEQLVNFLPTTAIIDAIEIGNTEVYNRIKDMPIWATDPNDWGTKFISLSTFIVYTILTVGVAYFSYQCYSILRKSRDALSARTLEVSHYLINQLVLEYSLLIICQFFSQTAGKVLVHFTGSAHLAYLAFIHFKILAVYPIVYICFLLFYIKPYRRFVFKTLFGFSTSNHHTPTDNRVHSVMSSTPGTPL